MKPGAHIVLAAATRFYAPIIVLAALLLIVLRLPGEGVGFVAGVMLGVALAVHVLVFGAAAAREAFPPYLARVLLGGGLMLAVVSAAAPRLAMAPQLGEAGVFIATASAISLVLAVLIGRAPTLRDEDSSMAPGFIAQALVLVGAFALLMIGVVAAWTAPNAMKRVAGVIIAIIAAIVGMAALQAPPSWLIAGAAVALAYCVVGTAVVVRLQEAYGAAEVRGIDAADDETEAAEPGA